MSMYIHNDIHMCTLTECGERKEEERRQERGNSMNTSASRSHVLIVLERYRNSGAGDIIVVGADRSG